MSNHIHKWVEVAKDMPTQTLHLDDWTMTEEVYVRYKCRCGKEKIEATNQHPKDKVEP